MLLTIATSAVSRSISSRSVGDLSLRAGRSSGVAAGLAIRFAPGLAAGLATRFAAGFATGLRNLTTRFAAGLAAIGARRAFGDFRFTGMRGCAASEVRKITRCPENGRSVHFAKAY